MKEAFRTYCFISLFFSQLCFPPPSLSDEIVLERFLQEAPKAWQDAKRRIAEKEMDFTTKRYRIVNGTFEPRMTLEGKFRQNGVTCFLIEGMSIRHRGNSEPNPYWVIGNHYYTASIARLDDATDSGFYLQKLELRNAEFPEKSSQEIFNWRLQPFLYPGYEFQNACLFDCFSNFVGSFTSQATFNYEVIDAIVENDETGRELVVLTVKQVYETEKGWEVQDGNSIKIKLLPEKNWALAEFNLKSKAAMSGFEESLMEMSMSTTCFYDDDSIHPTKVIEELKLGNSTQGRETTYRVSLSDKLSCTDCRLPAFGLTEPDDLVPKSFFWIYVWVFLGFLAICGVLFYLRKAK